MQNWENFNNKHQLITIRFFGLSKYCNCTKTSFVIAVFPLGTINCSENFGYGYVD